MASDEECEVVLTREEVETLHRLVTAKIEGVLVHSEEYFRLQDLAHKLHEAHCGAPR